LSNWSIAAGALVVLAVAAVVSFLLLRRYGGQGAQIQIDAIRTAGTLVIGTGGAHRRVTSVDHGLARHRCWHGRGYRQGR
jgi:hypothetical protein